MSAGALEKTRWFQTQVARRARSILLPRNGLVRHKGLGFLLDTVESYQAFRGTVYPSK